MLGTIVALAGRPSGGGAEAGAAVVDVALLQPPQACLVLAYLSLERRRRVPRSEVADMLWGDARPPTWDAALRGLTGRVRAFLGEWGVPPNIAGHPSRLLRAAPANGSRGRPRAFPEVPGPRRTGARRRRSVGRARPRPTGWGDRRESRCCPPSSIPGWTSCAYATARVARCRWSWSPRLGWRWASTAPRSARPPTHTACFRCGRARCASSWRPTVPRATARTPSRCTTAGASACGGRWGSSRPRRRRTCSWRSCGRTRTPR